MSDSESEKKSANMLRDMKLESTIEDASPACQPVSRVKDEDLDSPRRTPTPTPLAIPPRLKARSKSQSPVVKQGSEAPSPSSSTHEEVVGGEITLRMEPGKAPKLSRTASQKVVARTPPRYAHLPDSTEDAKKTFVVLPECTYANKTIGTTDPALECDCSEEWDPIAKRNHACGEDSDCINRATKMECGGDCGCGRKCQNQRFLRKQYADVTVIKTDKKGYGLRANKDMMPGDFVFEYIGEVIGESTLSRRMHQYDEEGIKHFYFMSLSKDEFVDATKKGNLGRFCNHSCNPNCFVDKWVVGDKLRMGIFVERKVRAGEELVFNYNVDRYGAEPQPCYCGEPNCTGFIGGKTQSNNATNLPHATIEALGIENGDGWDKAVAKKQRKKKTEEDDEEYVNNLQPRELEEEDVPKVMAALRQCTEKWIAVKLLSRIQQSENVQVGLRILRMHGYETLKKTLGTCLTTWAKDFNVIKQILEILHNLPRITRNKIQESKIEETIEELKSCGDEQVESSAASLLEAWSGLQVGYRIKKRDPNTSTPMQTVNHFERRERGRQRSRSRSKSPVISAPKGPSASTAPSGPRGLNAPRGPASFTGTAGFAGTPRPAVRPRPFNPLPPGWFQATADNGSTYFYNSTGTTQWTRPSQPVSQPPPPPPKSKTNTQLLQDIIAKITADPTPTNTSASNTPKANPADEHPEKRSKSEKWRSLSQEKQEKIYESTLSPHVMAVSSHYRKKFEKEELKRLCKEVAKKLVRGDYKSGRVKDPTAKLSSRHEKTVKHYVKDFLDKAVRKKEEREKHKASGGVKLESKDNTPATPLGDPKTAEVDHDKDMLDSKEMATASSEASPADSSVELKRKREDEEEDLLGSPKKSRTGMDELLSALPPPPPPPPPPIEDMPTDAEHLEFAPMDDAAESYSVVDKHANLTKVILTNANGHASPMQLATPPRNGLRSDEQKQEEE